MLPAAGKNLGLSSRSTTKGVKTVSSMLPAPSLSCLNTSRALPHLTPVPVKVHIKDKTRLKTCHNRWRTQRDRRKTTREIDRWKRQTILDGNYKLRRRNNLAGSTNDNPEQISGRRGQRGGVCCKHKGVSIVHSSDGRTACSCSTKLHPFLTST